MLDIIDGEVLRIDDIISQMLSFGNVGKQNTHTLVDISEILWDCIQIIRRQKAQKTIEVNFMPEENLPLIKAKNSDIQQIFLNILLNSLQAIEQDGRIDVFCSRDEEHKNLCIIFSDNGCGIPEDGMKKVFDPYYSTKANGTGLGLFFVKRIVDQYNGSIRLKSISGKGTICTVNLPYC